MCKPPSRVISHSPGSTAKYKHIFLLLTIVISSFLIPSTPGVMLCWISSFLFTFARAAHTYAPAFSPEECIKFINSYNLSCSLTHTFFTTLLSLSREQCSFPPLREDDVVFLFRCVCSVQLYEYILPSSQDLFRCSASYVPIELRSYPCVHPSTPSDLHSTHSYNSKVQFNIRFAKQRLASSSCPVQAPVTKDTERDAARH